MGRGYQPEKSESEHTVALTRELVFSLETVVEAVETSQGKDIGINHYTLEAAGKRLDNLQGVIVEDSIVCTGAKQFLKKVWNFRAEGCPEGSAGEILEHGKLVIDGLKKFADAQR